MNITFKTRKLEKVLNQEERLNKEFGADKARRIQWRMAVLSNAPTLLHVPYQKPERRHQLSGKQKEEFAVDVSKNYRLVFTPNHDPIPTQDDGGYDLDKITAIKILRVEDYHK